MPESTHHFTQRAQDGQTAVSEDINQPLRQLDAAIGKHTITITNPTNADNVGQGYTAGLSRWFNITTKGWWLFTDSSPNKWEQISVGGSIGSHNHDADDIISGLISLLVGGTGANLSATGPGVVVQDDAGDPLSVRDLAADDLPSASTTAQGAVELATNAETQDGDSASLAVTPAGAATTYYKKSEHIQTSSGSSDAGKPIVADPEGDVDASFVNSADVDHSLVSNLTLGDPHTQYILKSILTQKGDILVLNGNGDIVRLAIGGQGQILSVDLNELTGYTFTAPFSSGSGIPVDTVDQKGDLLVGSADNTIIRLGYGPVSPSWRNSLRPQAMKPFVAAQAIFTTAVILAPTSRPKPVITIAARWAGVIHTAR